MNNGLRNYTSKQRYGSNRWKDSDIRQWLNSDAPAVTNNQTLSNWWKPLTAFAMPPSGRTLSGFLYGMSQSVVQSIATAKIITAIPSLDRDGNETTDTTYDRVWLQSVTEVLGIQNMSVIEGQQLSYWVNTAATDRIKQINGEACKWSLRSAESGGTGTHVYTITVAGNNSSGDSNAQYGVVPTFCIKQYDGMKPIISYKRKIYVNGTMITSFKSKIKEG